TSQVCKVIHQIRFRAGKGYAWGALACAPVALAISRSQSDVIGALGSFILIQGLCPLVGIFIASGLKEPPDPVVYSAPGSCGPAHPSRRGDGIQPGAQAPDRIDAKN
ncbi:MAG TPA: hypothetical protein VGR07_23200, partial [Thermoanaerobaculia bacterium]|nr:hypothetical protein [Thermoanaerobaculia bacterium]